MKIKRYLALYLAVVIGGMTCFMLYNYVTDAYAYFKNDEVRSWDYCQYYKCRYIAANPEKYDCFIVGGSNAGVLNPNLINHYTGYRTYNFAFPRGNTFAYYEYVNFLVKHTKAKCIFLHLSSTEINCETAPTDDYCKIAVTEDRVGRVLEQLHFLTKQISFEKQVDELHLLRKDGSVDWTGFLEENKYDDDIEGYIERCVLAGAQNGISEKLFTQCEISSQAIEHNVENISKIKQLCDDNGIKLQIVIGPAFLVKRYGFECDSFYDYLNRIVAIADVWDFSGFTEINANPYNFYDQVHYSEAVADEMIRYMYEDSSLEQEFGSYLTADKMDRYLYNRKCQFREVLKEIRETGTLRYQSREQDSNITY